jgi:uncharacterized membrane protein
MRPLPWRNEDVAMLDTLSFIVTPLLWLHVACGFTALVLAPVAMLLRKGSPAHRRWGRVYFWAMAGIFVSALGVLVFRPNPFLFFISVLAFYAALTGYRGPRRKRPQGKQGPIWLDWAAAGAALLAGLGFVAWGALTLLGIIASQIPGAFSILAIVFGLALGRDAWTDLRGFTQPPTDRNWWWYYHMERMLGSYIAAVTAFLVQNVGRHLPPEWQWVAWVTPTLLGVPLIGLWIRHYRRLFAERAGRQSTPAPAVASLMRET